MFKTKILLVMTGLVLALFAGMMARISYLKADRNRVAFVADSTMAANDITHKRELHDQSQFYRFMIQVARLETDSLNRALKTESKLRASLQAKIRDTKTDGTTVATTDSSDITRHAEWTLYEEPFTFHVEVEVSKPPLMSTVQLTATIDSIPLNVSVECGQPINNIRPATLTFTTPQWMEVRLDTLTQARNVCNEMVRVPQTSMKKYAAWGTGGFIVGGLTYYFIRGRK